MDERQSVRVDCHGHFLPRDLSTITGALNDDRWPRVELDRTGDAGTFTRAGGMSRPVDALYWSIDRRLETLDRHGVTVQVVSPLPPLLVYGGPRQEARAYAAALNDSVAAHVATGGDRLVGLGTLPLADVADAVAEIDRATELGLAGFEIGTVVDGHELDSPSLAPFWDAAEERGTRLFLHPVEGESVNRIFNPLVRFGLGVPTDTALTVAGLIMSGVLSEHPELRLTLAHGGGTLPWGLMRLEDLWQRFFGPGGGPSPREIVRRLHLDLASVDAAGIAFLLESFEASHLMAGSDYPGDPDRSPMAAIEQFAAATGAGGDLLDAIGGSTAMAFYGIEQRTAATT